MSRIPSLEMITYDFKLAYQAANANPGQTVDFNGQLPCGFFAQQKIVAVPPGQNALTLARDLAKDSFANADRIIVNSSANTGTHIIATFGGLKSTPQELVL